MNRTYLLRSLPGVFRPDACLFIPASALLAAAICLAFAATAARAETVRGLLVYGHEERSLQPCGPGKSYWVVADPSVREALQLAVDEAASEPYEAVFAELEGEFGGTQGSAFGAGHEGGFKVNRIIEVRKAVADYCVERLPNTGTNKRSAGKAPGTVAQATTPADGKSTFVFRCERGDTYVVRLENKLAWVFGPQNTRKLERAAGTPPGHYTNARFDVVIDDQNARIGPTGATPQRCRNDTRAAVWEAAKLDGADFRAVGNEPGWHMTISEGSRLTLVTDYGQERVERRLSAPRTDAGTRTTVWSGEDVRVQVSGKPCTDTMSGESFESTVAVDWRGKRLNGCGRALH